MHAQNCLFQTYQPKAFVSTVPKTATQKTTGLRNTFEERDRPRDTQGSVLIKCADTHTAKKRPRRMINTSTLLPYALGATP